MKTIAKLRVSIVAFLICGLLLFTACDWIDTPTPKPTDPPSNSGQPPEPVTAPDLRISAVEVFPQHPSAGQTFALNIYVENVGDAKSGDYDVAIYIKDVGRGSTYPVGTFRKDGLHPGENVTAYTSTDRLVNDSGAFLVHIEIVPFLWDDGNAQNNVREYGFTVNP